MAEGLRGYDVLARHYDVLMQGLPYWRWADFIHRYAQNFGKGATILDAGCGAGTVTLALARRGYRVVGIDGSAEMLAQARAKDGADRVTWLHTSFWGVKLPCHVFISTCDGVNHLCTVQELVRFFRHAYSCLCPGGYLIFDINSPYKFQHILARETFYWRVPGLDLVWINQYTPPINRAHIILYEGGQSNYQKVNLAIEERCYTPSSLLYYLRRVGFRRISLWNNYRGRLRSLRASRITLVAQK
jgi:SAM-dependent methyltransferase